VLRRLRQAVADLRSADVLRQFLVPHFRVLLDVAVHRLERFIGAVAEAHDLETHARRPALTTQAVHQRSHIEVKDRDQKRQRGQERLTQHAATPNTPALPRVAVEHRKRRTAVARRSRPVQLHQRLDHARVRVEPAVETVDHRVERCAVRDPGRRVDRARLQQRDDAPEVVGRAVA